MICIFLKKNMNFLGLKACNWVVLKSRQSNNSSKNVGNPSMTMESDKARTKSISCFRILKTRQSASTFVYRHWWDKNISIKCQAYLKSIRQNMNILNKPSGQHELQLYNYCDLQSSQLLLSESRLETTISLCGQFKKCGDNIQEYNVALPPVQIMTTSFVKYLKQCGVSWCDLVWR